MLKLLCFLVPLFLFFANSSATNSTTCRTYNCNNGPQVRYPFWLSLGSSPQQHCGYQEFGFMCVDNLYTIFSPPPGRYYHVTHIDYHNHSIHLVDYDTANQTCPRALHNFPLGNLPLSHSPLNLDLAFYYNCTSYPSDVTPIRCLTSGLNESFVFVAGSETSGFDWSKNCGERVSVAVLKDQITSEAALINEFVGALNKGFLLDWQAPDNCDECEASDGLCGYSSDTQETLCFCNDGSVRSNSCSGKSRTRLSKLTIGLIAGGIGLLLIICTIIFCLRRKLSLILSAKFGKMTKNDQDIEAFIRNHGPLTVKRYTFSQIKKMTNSFQVKLGEGGYGSVYEGNTVNNCPVAVKVLNASKGNGEEFINEVLSISRTSHVNIVSLLGFCFETHKKALVYELMPNGSLEKYINKADLDTNPPLSWEKLHQIAEGIAKGLEYLHSGCNTRILHFDIKPNNILLDKNFCPKIADFGMAKLCSKTRSIVSMLDARGTLGYIAPEVWNRNFGGVSHKSDVYSYGMLVLETVGGRQNFYREVSDSSDTYFPHWVYRQIELDNNVSLYGAMNAEEEEIAKKMIIVGLWCIQTNPSDRPPMNRVIEMLEGSLEQLQKPPKPFIFNPTIITEGEYCDTANLVSVSSEYQYGR